MKRRVSLHGPATLGVSLPSEWVKKYGVEKGDELEVEEDCGSLVVGTNKGIKLSEKEIDISDLHPLINRTMMKIYQEGYDKVKINFGDSGLLKRVEDVLNQFIGFEMIEQGEGFCVVKDISGSSGDDFDAVFRRMFLLMKDIFKEGQEVLELKDKGKIGKLIERDMEINKITNFCLRVLNKKISLSHKDCMKYHAIIHTCEKIGDEYKKILSDFVKGKFEIDADLVEEHKKVVDFFDKIYNFNFDLGKKGAISIAKDYEQINEKGSFFKNIYDLSVFIQDFNYQK